MPPKRKSNTPAEAATEPSNKRQRTLEPSRILALWPMGAYRVSRGRESCRRGRRGNASLLTYYHIESLADEYKSQGNDGGDLANRPPYEYYCINRHFFDFENENNDKEGDDQLDEDQVEEQYNELLKNGKVALRPVAEFPDHKWVALWATWTTICEYRRRAMYTCPDAFGIYIYNDFNGYGLQELVENLLASLNEEFKKKEKTEESFKKMWALSAGMIHWLLIENLGPWMNLDDGDRVSATIELIGRSFLTTLSELDRVHQLGEGTPIKDLGLVMSLYLSWADDLSDYSIDEGDFNWRREIVAYAKHAQVDLVVTGCYGVGDKLEALEDLDGDIEPIGPSRKADRWDWKKSFTAHAKTHTNGKMGGEKFNICKFSRKERAKYAFDKRDPLAKISEKDLREGNLMLG